MESTPPWLREALRFALTATASTPAPWSQHESDNSKAASGGDLVDPNDPGKDPRFRKLVEAILYGRRLLNTYNLVLVGVLLFFTLWHWAEKLVLHQRIRKAAATRTSNSETASAEDAEAWSSSSSTVGGSVTPPDAVPVKNASSADESSPLLPSRRLQPKSVGIWRPYYLLKAALQYQPPQIPVIHKTLPTNAVSLLVLAWIGLIIFYNFYRMPLEFKYLFVFGDRCGLVFVTNLPLLYLLAAKNQPIKFLTGYSYESLNIFHRRVGEVMCLEAFVHFLGMVLTWYGMLRHLGFTLAKFLFNRVVLLGLAAFIAYELIYFTSLGSFRQRWYEIFLALHVVLQLAGLIFLWFHHSTSRPYVAISLGIWLIDRVVYRLWLKSSTHPATLTVLEDEETILVSANWEVSSQKSALAPKNMNQGWKPNEHIFLTVPALSRKHTLQSHPFTIFSAAPTVSEDNSRANHAWFTLLIRAQAKSGFTHTLLEHARTTPRTRIRLDGPYGSSHALDMLEASSTAVLIAGGSGIAVAYPLLYALLCPSSTDPEAAAIRTKRKVKLLWITHAPAHRLWIPDDKLEELENWGLDVLIPPPTSLAGRPNAGYILREWVGQGTDRDGGRAGVVVSGPDGLVRDVRNTCASLIWGGRDVDVQVEKFGW